MTDGLREWGYKKSLTDAEMDRATERFVNYWQGSGKAKTDWPATWRGWMLREIEEGRMGANGGRTNGRTPHPQTDVVAAVFAEMRANGEIE